MNGDQGGAATPGGTAIRGSDEEVTSRAVLLTVTLPLLSGRGSLKSGPRLWGWGLGLVVLAVLELGFWCGVAWRWR